MNRQPVLWIVLLTTGMLLAGCYEKPQARFYEPGVYQGRTDPLLAVQTSAEQQQKLQQRVSAVQMDR